MELHTLQTQSNGMNLQAPNTTRPKADQTYQVLRAKNAAMPVRASPAVTDAQANE